MNIKPHHFFNIIKLYGAGIEYFVPDQKFDDDFCRIANLIISDPQTVFWLTLSSDDICQSSRSSCQDELETNSKGTYNPGLDKCLVDIYGLSLTRVYTAFELCMVYYQQIHLIASCWQEETSISLAQRIDDFKTGAKKYIERYAPSPSDDTLYRAGVMDAFCEVVRAGVKKIALSHATSDLDQWQKDLYWASRLAEKYQIHFYIEHDLLSTLLFQNSGQHVLIFYRDPQYIEAYLKLKQEAQDTYEKRRQVAYAYGTLLSYDQNYIDQMLNS